MNTNNFNWNEIRSINGSQNEGFEEFVCQLARNEYCKNGATYTRIGKPDGGRECFISFPNGSQYHFQAKYFTSALDDSQFSQINDSVKSDIDHFHNVKKYFISIATDLPDGVIEGRKSCMQKWNDYVTRWEDYAKEQGKVIEIVRWDSSELISRISKPENDGLMYFFFNKQIFTDEWFYRNNANTITDLGTRYTPENNIDLKIYTNFDALFKSEVFDNDIHEKCKQLHLKLENIKNTLYPGNEKIVKKLIDFFNFVKNFSFSTIQCDNTTLN